MIVAMRNIGLGLKGDGALPDRDAAGQGRLRDAGDMLESSQGMIGFDEGGWNRAASREAPISLNQRNKQVPIAQTSRLFHSPPKAASSSPPS